MFEYRFYYRRSLSASRSKSSENHGKRGTLNISEKKKEKKKKATDVTPISEILMATGTADKLWPRSKNSGSQEMKIIMRPEQFCMARPAS